MPTSRRRRSLAVLTSVATLGIIGALLPVTAAFADSNLSQGKSASESSHNDVYPASNLFDGNQATYWESANNAFPQWAQVDLGSSASVERLVLEIPNGWGARNETIAVSTSSDGSSFSTIKAATSYAFPGGANTLNVDVPDTTARYVRLTFTANSGWPAGQLSELQVFGTPGGGSNPGDPGNPGNPNPPGGTKLSQGRPITASSTVFTYAAANANDGDTGTYWESGGGAYPANLTVSLATSASLSGVVVKLNPSAAWGARTENVAVQGRASGASGFTTLVAAANYTFDPATGNTVNIPVSGSAQDVRLVVTSNTQAPGAQAAEFEVWGTPAATPDLTVTGVTASPSAPNESQAIDLAVAVKNVGTAASPATSVQASLGGNAVGTASVGALAVGASTTVHVSAPAQAQGSYAIIAKVDPAGSITELDETNNTFTSSSNLVVSAVPSADLVTTVTWNPSAPQAGQATAFSVVVKNQGTLPSSASAHAITVTVKDGTGAPVKTLTGSVSGVIAAGASSSAVNVGSWTAANGGYTVTASVAADSAEVAAKQSNNSTTASLFVGRGANMPYTSIEAETGTTGGGASVVGPNRTIGDLAGEASGRKAVVLDNTGEYVQFTTPVATNTLVTRFAMPDAAGGGGQTNTLALYVDGVFKQNLSLTSAYAWLYGNETNPGNDPGQGSPRHIYDEASFLLTSTIPAGSTIKLQKDSGNTAAYYSIDFVDLEVATPIANPDPSRYIVPAGFNQQAVQNAINAVIADPSKLGVYLPAGTYTNDYKFQVYGRAMNIIGAGPWFTKFTAPGGATNTDIGFNGQSSSSGSTFSGFSYFGNYTSRIDGPGKVFDFTNVSNMTVDNIWAEHMICLFWASNMDNSTVQNSRIRDTFADGINMTNGSSGNHVVNNSARSTGDDSFALFAATDGGGTGQQGNVFENLTSLLTWRAAGLAVYGGQDNTFRNIYIADTLVYSGVTISSLDFGIPMEGFGPKTTTFDGITVVRGGGHFWGSQTFPAVWMFSASKTFTAISVKNLDIIDPTYSGIMFQTNYSGSQPQNPFQNTTFQNVSITGAKKSGDAFDAKSGFGIWVNELPEPGQGPAVGSATFTGSLVFSGNAQNVKNTTSTFTLNLPQ
ncbi:glycosyl hydrolase [Glaciibacter flavus]|uniref:Glycosyl hydrolase n=1 Tax=Orlajensenia flava TaxID=2565934 RepID=A0A4S4FXU6_9MICO|nr:discoidin domain-containing protein [Glaciibacter flavus]THG34536.1 glycosyl hydrolase [Glaciibacter flavus]